MFDIPYKVVSYPFGLRGSVEFLESIASALGIELDHRSIETERERLKEKLERVYGFLEGIYNLKTAIVGESGRAFDLARFLNDELCLDVKLLGVTSANAETARRRRNGDYFEHFLKKYPKDLNQKELFYLH